MKRRTSRPGFTIVELVVVIVIIAILAVVTAVLYNSAQKQSRDVALADAADKVADAIQLFTQRQGHWPRGGWGSSTAPSGGECANGADGWFVTGTYTCTVEDTLIRTGYLPAGFSSNFPINTEFGNTSSVSMMVYNFTPTMGAQGTNKGMVFYSMEDYTADDTAHFNAEMQKCGLNPAGTISQRDEYKMRNGICISY